MNEIERAIKDFENFKQAGYTHCELPSSWHIELAISALREKQERENPQPLTLDELQEMADTREWAWVEMNFGTVGWCKPFQKYPLSMKNVDGGYVTERDFERGFIEGAYRYPPKEGDKL